MPATREQIFTTLFAQLQTAQGFVTYSERYKLLNKMTPEEQPYLCMVTHDEEYTHTGARLSRKLILPALVIIRASTPDQTSSGRPLLNNLIDAVEKAVGPDDPALNVNTLKGLVNRCWIEGRVRKATGDILGQMEAIIPIKILVP